MNKKGVFFSVDALVALGVATLLFAMLFYWSSQLDVQQLNNNELVEYSKSVASVMEQQGAFAQSNISSFLGNYTKNETCFNVSVYTPANVLVYSVVKSGCSTTSYPVFVSRSFVLANTSLYHARLAGWYA